MSEAGGLAPGGVEPPPARTGVRQVFAITFRNPAMARIGLAFAGFNAAEWGVWIALLVYAYDHGGAAGAGLAAVVQLVPAGLCAPFAAQLVDRRAPVRVLAGGYLAQSLTMGMTAAALLVDAPPVVVYVLAGLAASATTVTRPTQAALVPALVRTIDELTSANVVMGWIESVSLLVAPAAAGALLAVSEPAAVFVLMAGLTLVSAALVAPIHGPAAAEPEDDEEDASHDILAGLRLVRSDPQVAVLVGILSLEFVLIGALDVLFVVLAIDVLDLGGSGAGYLNAAFGAGGVIGIAATVRLVGRPRLAPTIVVASLAWSIALLVLGLWDSALAAFLLLALAGAGRTMLDVATRALLQRSAPAGVMGRVFGVLETLDAIGLAIGSVLAPLLVSALGAQAAVAGLAVILPVTLLLARRKLLTIDANADVPVVEIALLRLHALFATLSAPVIEGLARELTPVALAAGESVIHEGQFGERYYVIADGRLEASQSGMQINTVGRGEGVGEISLLARIPCTATVTALTDAQLYAIERKPFIELVTGHSASAGAADRIVRERLQRSAST